MKSEATSGISVKKKNSEIDLERKLLIAFLAVVVSSGVWFASASLGQDAPAPGGGEPAKVEAPAAAPGAPAEAAAKKKIHRRSLPRGYWNRSAGRRWRWTRCGP